VKALLSLLLLGSLVASVQLYRDRARLEGELARRDGELAKARQEAQVLRDRENKLANVEKQAASDLTVKEALERDAAAAAARKLGVLQNQGPPTNDAPLLEDDLRRERDELAGLQAQLREVGGELAATKKRRGIDAEQGKWGQSQEAADFDARIAAQAQLIQETQGQLQGQKSKELSLALADQRTTLKALAAQKAASMKAWTEARASNSADWQTRIDELESEQAGISAEYSAEKAECDDLAHRLKDAKAVQGDYGKSVAALRAEFQARKGKVSALQAEIDEHRRRVSALGQ
jgi:chromosome segregation ATPase